MSKILSGLLGSFLVLAVVAGSAYAVFADNVPVNGLTLGTGNADLQINGEDSLTLTSPLVSNTYPGWQDGVEFNLKNNSTSNIGLDVTAHLDSATGDWGSLNSVVEAEVIEYDNSTDAANDLTDHIPGNGTGVVSSTGFQTLATWNGTPILISHSGSPLTQGDTRYYVLWGLIPSTADNSIANKSLTTNWTVTGTQH